MSDIPINEISTLLDEVSTKVPKLISALMSSLYSAEAGKNMGQAVGSLYKELLASGLPEEVCVEMAKDYMLTLKSVTSSFNK